jgi:hypothetical protein
MKEGMVPNKGELTWRCEGIEHNGVDGDSPIMSVPATLGSSVEKRMLKKMREKPLTVRLSRM